VCPDWLYELRARTGNGNHFRRRPPAASRASRPDLRFTVEDVYHRIDTIVINYRNQNDRLVNAVLRFQHNLVIEGHGT